MSKTQPKQQQADVVKIFGGPGTGKTTTMVGNTGLDDFQGMLHQLFEERPAGELMLIAYTRSAADEAKDRLYELTDLNKKTLDNRVTTIHSLTMSMNNVNPTHIVEIRNVPDKYNFCESVGLQYESNPDDDDIMEVPDDEGHIFFRILSWLRSNMKTLSNWEECPISHAWPRGEADLLQFASGWESYKDNKNIYEFDDVIRMSVNKEHTVDASELFVDEVQDLYPLQQAFLDNQMEAVDRVWLAGDDDQTIYEWAGANPDYFIDMETDPIDTTNGLWEDKTGYWADEGTYILDQSYRMPERVMRLSQTCIERVDARQEKEIKPYNQNGEIHHLQWPQPGQVADLINHDDTFILCRANFQCGNVGQTLIQEGIPFQDRFRTWRDSTVKIRDAILAMYNGDEYVDGDVAQQLVEDLQGSALERSVKWGNGFAGQDRVSTDELAGALKVGKPTSDYNVRRLTEMLDEQNYFQQQAIQHNITRGKGHLEPDGVTIETIHWSKGQEADTVILALNTTNAVMGETAPGVAGMPDAERRLYYVGMTRTENRLVLAEHLDNESPSFSAEELFGEEWQEDFEIQ